MSELICLMPNLLRSGLKETSVKSSPSYSEMVAFWSTCMLFFQLIRNSLVIRSILLLLVVRSFDSELGGEDVGELGAKTVSTSCHFLLGVVVVAGGEQMAEDEFRDIHVVRGVHLDGDACLTRGYLSRCS